METQQLTVTQVVAITAVQAAVTQARTALAQAKGQADQAEAKWRFVMNECGLDQAKTWQIAQDGSYKEIEGQGPPAPAKRKAPEPVENGRG